MSIDFNASGTKIILEDTPEKKLDASSVEKKLKAGVESKTIKTKTTSVPSSNGKKKVITKKVITKYASQPVRKKLKKKLKRRQYQTVWGFLKFW